MGDSCPESGTLEQDLALSGTINDLREATASITVTNGTLLPGAHLRIASGSGEELIVYNGYDELGQLAQKKVGGTPGTDYETAQGLQTVDYRYNVRGWLTNINDVTVADPDKLFNFNNGYNQGANPLYNGNISQTQWRTANTDSSLKTYDYAYDAMNRIVGAVDNTGNYNLSNVSYDKNGNILTLNRNGWQDSSTFIDMDILDYGYDSGNKLLKIVDTGDKAHGFIDGTNINDDFDYDMNGNLILDRNKGITGITYNHLNLPEQVNFGSDNIKYVYDAMGARLKRTSSMGTETLYANGYIYEGGVGIAELQFFGHPEGYVTPDGQSGYGYIYNYVDNLGSVRLSYIDADGDGNIDPANEIIDDNAYYPFGLLMRSATSSVSPYGNSAAKRWKFSGKELDETFDIDTYDFGARNYDPTIGRWMNIDPLAEQMRRYSPYNYAFNNPIFFIDPDGMAPTYNWGAGRYEDEDGNEVGWDTVQKEYGLNSSREGDCCNDNVVAKMMKRAKNALLHAFGLDIKAASDELDEAQSEKDVASAIEYLKKSKENLDITNENLKDVAEILATFEPTGLTGVYYEYTLGGGNSDKTLAILAIIPYTKLAKGAKVIKFIQAGKKVETLVPSGFKVIKGVYSHGQKVYSNGKIFKSPDKDGHIKGSVWKAANSLKDLGNKKSRLGTFDGLFQKIGD